MSAFEFKFTPAERCDVLLRILLVGQSGHGKTYSALALAHHLVGDSSKVGFIDTETQEQRRGGEIRVIGSAEKYVYEKCDCHRCQGQGLEFGKVGQLKLPPSRRGPDDYRNAVNSAAAAGFEVLIVDSMSHEWTACKELVDKLKPKFGGNQWAAWSEVTAMHDRFLQSLLDFPGHVIACCRGKEKTEQVQDGGRKRVKSRGLLPLQREGIEFEFDVWFNMNRASAVVMKTRAKRLWGRVFDNPGEGLAGELLEWANSGQASEDRAPTVDAITLAKIRELIDRASPEIAVKASEQSRYWRSNQEYANKTLARLEQVVGKQEVPPSEAAGPVGDTSPGQGEGGQSEREEANSTPPARTRRKPKPIGAPSGGAQ